VEGLDTLLKKIQETGSTDQRHEIGRLMHARTKDNVTAVDELVLSQECHTQSYQHIVQHARYPKRRVV